MTTSVGAAEFIRTLSGHHDCHETYVHRKLPRVSSHRIAEGGGPDPEVNSTLAAVIKRVKAQGVPKDNIEAAIKKVSPCRMLKLRRVLLLTVRRV